MSDTERELAVGRGSPRQASAAEGPTHTGEAQGGAGVDR